MCKKADGDFLFSLSESRRIHGHVDEIKSWKKDKVSHTLYSYTLKHIIMSIAVC